ncbi:WxL domain-containing protein [Lacticaseibacillus suihuaensis]
MKNIKFLICGVILAAGLLTLPTTVHAADQTQNSNVNIDITGNKDGALTLDQVPDLDFTSTADKLNERLHGTATQPVKVSDTRGTGAGWQLAATLGAVTKPSGVTLDLQFNSNKLTGDASVFGGAAAVGSAAGMPTGTASQLIVAAPGTGMGTTQLDFNNLTLGVTNLPATAGTYSAPITWTLSDTQTSSSSN